MSVTRMTTPSRVNNAPVRITIDNNLQSDLNKGTVRVELSYPVAIMTPDVARDFAAALLWYADEQEGKH